MSTAVSRVTLDIETARKFAIAPSGGQISVTSRAFDCRFGGSREPSDFCNRLLSARAPTICFGLPPRAWCDPDTTDKHFQLQVLPDPLQFSAHGLRKIAQIASGHRLCLISFAG